MERRKRGNVKDGSDKKRGRGGGGGDRFVWFVRQRGHISPAQHRENKRGFSVEESGGVSSFHQV